jgi:hypothetical protein
MELVVRQSYYLNLIYSIDIKESKSSTHTTTSKWTKIKNWVPQGSILGRLLFLVYINNLPRAVEHKAVPIQFAAKTSILLTSPNNTQLQSNLNEVFMELNKWFKSNLLFFNFDKTPFIQFTNKSSCITDMEVKYEDKQVCTVNKQSFLGYWSIGLQFLLPKISRNMHALIP